MNEDRSWARLAPLCWRSNALVASGWSLNSSSNGSVAVNFFLVFAMAKDRPSRNFVKYSKYC